MANRGQRRRATKGKDMAQATITMRGLSPVIYVPDRPATTSLTMVAPSDFQLWYDIVFKSLLMLGIRRDDLRMGFFLELLNHATEETRKMLAIGILNGLGFDIIQNEEDGEVVLQVELSAKYPNLMPEAQEAPGKLWTPGDPV